MTPLNEAIVSVEIDSRWTSNSREYEGLSAPIHGGPVTLTTCPRCGSGAFECLHQKTEGRFEEYQETVGCEECGAKFTIHYAMALKAVKLVTTLAMNCGLFT